MECGKTRYAVYYLQSARQNNVFFRPAMNLLAVWAGELRCFHFGSGPELFIDCLAGRRQLGRSGAANKEPLNYGASFYLSYGRCSEKSHSLRGGRRCAPYQCRKVTFEV